MWIFPIRQSTSYVHNVVRTTQIHRRLFNDYFTTYLPSSSLHPDSKYAGLDLNKSSRKEADRQGKDREVKDQPIGITSQGGISRETTVVRIPIKSAKHHFGVSISRGSRPYNEDAYQAGTIEVSAFANREPISWNRKDEQWGKKEPRVARNANVDSQVFYYGVFDGHGGSECSDWLREQLHTYIEDSARLFRVKPTSTDHPKNQLGLTEQKNHNFLPEKHGFNIPASSKQLTENFAAKQKVKTADPESTHDVLDHEKKLLQEWDRLVGGYFKRFKPAFFASSITAKGSNLMKGKRHEIDRLHREEKLRINENSSLEAALMYAFLKADFDFIYAQSRKEDQEDTVLSDRALNEDDVLDNPYRPIKRIGGLKRFNGGSTCSIALISTPTPKPYWDPATPCTLVTAHVGDTRLILCNTTTGLAEAVTTDHHPSYPVESQRLRRYAGSFVTDSFGEERISGLANSRSFGDMTHKRIGISAEPEVRRLELGPAEYSFLVLVSDGVSGVIGDQEIADIVKEAKTPELAAREVVSFATEVSIDADNATALVVRLGGWERRSEGGLGSLGSKEMRDWRKAEAQNPRRRT